MKNRMKMKMKFKKIKRILFSMNYERNLILLQEFSKLMIDLIDDNIEIINIDEQLI